MRPKSTPKKQQSLSLSEKNSSAIVTRTFTLTPAEVQLIESVRAEENLLSDSAALRRLIHDGKKFRELMREAQHEVAKQWLKRS